MRVLVAEDEVRLAVLLTQVLLEAGYTAVVVHDGLEALEVARRGGFDVLLLDWMMPGMEGPEVLRTLRGEGHATPALVLTARGEVRDRIDGLDAGAVQPRGAARPAAGTAPAGRNDRDRGCARW